PAGDVVAGAQAEATDLRLRHVDISGTGEQPLTAEEAEAVVYHRQHATREAGAVTLGLPHQDAEDELVGGEPGRVLDFVVALGELDQLLTRLRLEFSDVDGRDVRVRGALFEFAFPLAVALFARTTVRIA